MKNVAVAILMGVWSLMASAQDSPALQAAKADAKRIGDRQCEHALVMQRINKWQPGTPERIKAEKELDAVIDRAHREQARDDRHRANVKRLSDIEQGTVDRVYSAAVGGCGAK